MYSDILKKQVPDFISGTQIFNEIYNSEGAELDNLNAAIEDVKAQLDIDGATWGLDIYEKELNITTNYTKSYADRRSVIKSKWRGSGTLNLALLESIIDSFTNGGVSVTFDGTIHIKFNSVKGIPPNMDDVYATLDEMLPAYLTVDYKFSYTLWGDISSTQWEYFNDVKWGDLPIIPNPQPYDTVVMTLDRNSSVLNPLYSYNYTGTGAVTTANKFVMEPIKTTELVNNNVSAFEIHGYYALTCHPTWKPAAIVVDGTL